MDRETGFQELFEEIVYHSTPYKQFQGIYNDLDTDKKNKLLSYIQIVLDDAFINNHCSELHDHIRLGLDENSPTLRIKKYREDLQNIIRIENELKMILIEADILRTPQTENDVKRDNSVPKGKFINIHWEVKHKTDFIRSLYSELVKFGYIDEDLNIFYTHFQPEWDGRKIKWIKEKTNPVALFYLLSKESKLIQVNIPWKLVLEHFEDGKGDIYKANSLKTFQSRISTAIRDGILEESNYEDISTFINIAKSLENQVRQS